MVSQLLSPASTWPTLPPRGHPVGRPPLLATLKCHKWFHFHAKREIFPNKFLYFSIDLCFPFCVKYTFSFILSYQLCACLGASDWHTEKPYNYSYLMMHFIFPGFRRICFFLLNPPFPHGWFLNINDSTIFSNTQVGNQRDIYLHSPPSPPHLPTISPPDWPSNLLPNMTGLALIFFLLGYFTLLTSLSAFSLSAPIHSAMPPKQSSYKVQKKKKITYQVCLRLGYKFPLCQH